MIRFILCDIEGTTTSISFVHEVLFPYARIHLESYVQTNLDEPKVQDVIQRVQATILEEQGLSIGTIDAIETMLHWIDKDRKHTALKDLQGYIWKAGYQSGDYQGHLYDDVRPAFERWLEKGIQLGIYSSGSVDAQKLLFGYSSAGDLRPLFSAYFDTNVGHKRAEASYRTIQHQLGIPSEEILFLSDVPAELDAAQAAGFHALQSVRPGIEPGDGHQQVADFSEIDALIQR